MADDAYRMTNLDEALQIAYGHHQAGDVRRAEQIYRQILQADPRHVKALHLLGVVALQSGQHEAAIRLISDAVRLEGANIHLHMGLGEAYREAGRLDEAVLCYQRAASLEPRLALPHLFLGLLDQARGDLSAAREALQRAIELESEFADAHYALGNVLRMLGDPSAALASYQRALAINPNYFEVLLNLGSMTRECGRIDEARGYLHRAIQLRPELADGHFFLGNLEAACDQWPLAIECYERATRLNPNLAAAWARLGSARQVLGQLDLAMEHYRRAIQLQPDLAEAYYNLGTALAECGRMDEAVEHYERCLQYDPNFIGAHVNLAAYHQEKGDEERALVHIRRGMEIDPAAPQPHFNLALILLVRGELAAGWTEFDARLRLPKFPVRSMSEPMWDGSPIPGKTLLVHVEQGLGDTLHFSRYAPLAAERCGTLLLLVQDPLIPLLRLSGFEHLFGEHDVLPPFDFQAPIMSLPGRLGTTLENLPADVPYLSVSADKIESWKARLGSLSGLRVGIVWKGSSTHINDTVRSIPLAEFAPLACLEGVTLVSLQKREGVEQLREIDFPVHEIEGDWDEPAGPFVDTAAVMKNLDLVITADTAAAHLAGALAVPVWVALAVRSDWRWMRDREDSPWYPTMRLFRQNREGDWAEVFARIARELERFKTAKQPQVP